MDAVTGRRICELVMGIIATDRELHPSELTFMLKTFEAFGVAQSGDDEAVTPTTRALEAARAMGQLPKEVREEAVELLIDSAVVDGKVVPEERKYLHAVAKAAGVPRDEMDSRIEAKLNAQRGAQS
jgi:uncharacterized tellurite resistance protein B-like protein